MSKIYTMSVACTQDPSMSITCEYTQEMLDDLKSLMGLDGEVELARVLQAEADAEYERMKNESN